MTASSVLSVVRRELNDSDATAYRWSDAVLLVYLGAAQRHIYELRPDLRLKTDGTVQAVPGEFTATSDTVALAEDYKQALAMMTCRIALDEDSDDRGNAEKAAQCERQAHLLLGLLRVSA